MVMQRLQVMEVKNYRNEGTNCFLDELETNAIVLLGFKTNTHATICFNLSRWIKFWNN